MIRINSQFLAAVIPKTTFFCCTFAFWGVPSIHADDITKTYISIQQNGTQVEAVGTAAFDISKNPTLEFDTEGNSIITVNDNIVAKLPISNGGEMVMKFNGTSDNTINTTVTSAGYSTLYSPFQLTVPSGIEVYAPVYDETTQKLKLNNSTLVAVGSILPAGTGVILKNKGCYTFDISDSEPTNITSALRGSAISIPTSSISSGTVYSLANGSNGVAFYRYTAENIVACKAFLVLNGNVAQSKAIMFDFGDNATDIKKLSEISYGNTNRLYYNLAGQRINTHKGQGLVIKNGKKISKK